MSREPGMLFVGGPQRSGTTALVHYLNLHPEVLVCMERYKWLPWPEIRPELFAFERILDYRMSPQQGREETNTPREYHEDLLAGKDRGRLKWIGDKNPGYVRKLGRISENNPGASFILTYRPLEEVAESFEARSRGAGDPWLLGGFEEGVDYWNTAMRSTRDFIESAVNLNVLILDYHDFFRGDRAAVPQLARFLDIEFDGEMLGVWEKMSGGFESSRRPKESLSREQRAYVEANRDAEAESWVLDHLRRQQGEFALHSPETFRLLAEERRASAIRVAEEMARVSHLRKRNRELERQLRDANPSGGRLLLDSVGRLKEKLLRPSGK